MKITIDTKEDSHEEIRRVIKMLSSLVGENEIMETRNVFDEQSPTLPEQNVFGNMFENKEAKNAEEPEEASKDEDVPRIMEY